MQQVLLTAPFTLEIQNVEIPRPSDDEVLLRIHNVGICASDMQMYHGLHKYMTYPVVIGHEVGAEIVEVGRNVTGFQVGDRVTVQPQLVCGTCYPCRIGHYNVCEHLRVRGVHADGFCCEYATAAPFNLHKIPDSMSYETAALIEPIAVGMGAVNRAGIGEGSTVVVVGAGTIGNVTAQSARARGANVLVADVSETKLEIARTCGFTQTVNTACTPLREAIAGAFGAQKAEVIIDCAGAVSGFNSIVDAARPASKIVITGNYKRPVELELPRIQRQNIDLLGDMMYLHTDFIDSIRLVGEGRFQLDPIVTGIFPMKDVALAMKSIDEHADTSMKVLLQVSSQT